MMYDLSIFFMPYCNFLICSKRFNIYLYTLFLSFDKDWLIPLSVLSFPNVYYLYIKQHVANKLMMKKNWFFKYVCTQNKELMS